MKAQKFFGGTSPKQTGSRVRQVGSFSATPGVSAFKNNAGRFSNIGKGRVEYPIPNGPIDPRNKVKQVGTFSGGQGNNSKMLRDNSLSTVTAKKRPNIAGKVDNRVGKGNGQ